DRQAEAVDIKAVGKEFPVVGQGERIAQPTHPEVGMEASREEHVQRSAEQRERQHERRQQEAVPGQVHGASVSTLASELRKHTRNREPTLQSPGADSMTSCVPPARSSVCMTLPRKATRSITAAT